MKKLFLLFTLSISMASFAKTYNCIITQDKLSPEFSGDLSFVLETRGSTAASLYVMGDLVSDDCQKSQNNVRCRDAEGMPYILKITNQRSVSLEVGYYIPMTKAECR